MLCVCVNRSVNCSLEIFLELESMGSNLGYVPRSKDQDTLTLEIDVADDLKSEGERCELPRGREQVNAEKNIGESHAVDFPEDETNDSCSETEKTINPNCLKSIKTARRSTTKKTVRSFLRLLNCYRDQIPSFAAISGLLRDLTSKEQPNKIKLGEEQEKAFWILQERRLKN